MVHTECVKMSQIVCGVREDIRPLNQQHRRTGHEPASLSLSRLPRQSRTYSAPTTTDPLPKSEAPLLPYP